jgi:hypothetical protein
MQVACLTQKSSSGLSKFEQFLVKLAPTGLRYHLAEFCGTSFPFRAAAFFHTHRMSLVRIPKLAPLQQSEEPLGIAFAPERPKLGLAEAKFCPKLRISS